MAPQTLAPEAITQRISTVRGQRVIADNDLAGLYGVETRRFDEAVKRNQIRPDQVPVGFHVSAHRRRI